MNRSESNLRPRGATRVGARLVGVAVVRAAVVSAAVVSAALLAPRAALSAPFIDVPVQGLLRTSGGGPVSDGLYTMTFSLYESEAAPQPFYTEIQVGVQVTGGTFAALVGQNTPLDLALFIAHSSPWVGVAIGAEPELPRKRLHRAPIAGHALSAASLGCTGCVGFAQLQPGLLDANNIALAIGNQNTTVAAELAKVAQAIKIAGPQIGLAKNPAAACGLDVATDGGKTCIDGVPALWTRIVPDENAMQQLADDGQLAYRSDDGSAWMRAKGVWRKVAFQVVCGDGFVEPPEACDDGKANAMAPDACRPGCTLPMCGDGVQDSGEACDDGNGDDTDACVTGCKLAVCGDGFVHAGVEPCDDGQANAMAPDACRPGCVLPACGDGVLDSGEGCDDGNKVAGDGCDPDCNNEITLDATFTHCGASGRFGPNQGQCDAAYAGTQLEGLVTVNSGIQTFTVPATGTYVIEAWGARSGYETSKGVSLAGRGIKLSGEFQLQKGQVLKVLVGHIGQNNSSSSSGGGGGSFVALSDNTPLIVAGGGGGHEGSTKTANQDATASENGQPGGGACEDWAGGTGGNGATDNGGGNTGGGGGGFYTNGGGGTKPGGPGVAFVNGGAGGKALYNNVDGGFGGGGGAWGNGGGAGGGGGYSGGGMGDNCSNATAGGGGSFNSGANPQELGYQSGYGQVRIKVK